MKHIKTTVASTLLTETRTKTTISHAILCQCKQNLSCAESTDMSGLSQSNGEKLQYLGFSTLRLTKAI